jgi:hypothetical protein
MSARPAAGGLSRGDPAGTFRGALPRTKSATESLTLGDLAVPRVTHLPNGHMAGVEPTGKETR